MDNNPTILWTDKYSFTTSYALFLQKRHMQTGSSEVFYRRPNCKKYPFVILSGTHFVLEFVKNINFTDLDLEILAKTLGIPYSKTGPLNGKFLEYLQIILSEDISNHDFKNF